MDYQSSISFNGDPEKALNNAIQVLKGLNFEINQKRSSWVEFIGSNKYRPKQNPIYGASRIELQVQSSRITLEAEFGGFRRIGFSLTLFLIGFILLNFSVMWILFQNIPGINLWYFLGAFVPLPFLTPLVIRRLKKRTHRALDSLLRIIKTMGKED